MIHVELPWYDSHSPVTLAFSVQKLAKKGDFTRGLEDLSLDFPVAMKGTGRRGHVPQELEQGHKAALLGQGCNRKCYVYTIRMSLQQGPVLHKGWVDCKGLG